MIGAKKIDKGQILINNFDVEKEANDAKKSFGYTSSEPTAYEVMTGNEYLDFIADVYEMSEDAFQGNKEFLIRKFNLKPEDMRRRISTYSHGMKQKICLMASLLYNPKIWILDEPTVGLDIIVFETLKDMMIKFAVEQSL